MTFSRNRSHFLHGWGLAALVAVFGLFPAVEAAARAPVALVPTKTIYPGEVLTRDHVETVEVTNPNIAGGYASEVAQIDGLIARQTLLPGRTIPLAALRVPAAVTRGGNVRLVFNIGNLTLSASGSPLTDGAIGDVVRARNLDSGVIVSGTVMSDGTIQVMAK
jgi:flagella basal body P-ring formation protein FlgA